MRTRLLILLTLVLSSCSGHHLPTPVARIARAQVSQFEHVFVVVEENENYADVIGNTKDMPYLNMLAARYGLATNYFANTHPSINNYFFLTAGRMGTADEEAAFKSAWRSLSAGSHPGVSEQKQARIGLVLALEFGQLLLHKFD